MINTVIIDDNIEYIKFLINCITSNFKNVRVTHIITNGKDALEIIEKNNIDLVLLDLKMPYISGIDIVEKIKIMNLVKIPKIIIISGEMDYIYCIKNEAIISNIIVKNSSIEAIKNKIQNTINAINYFQNASKINELIIDELKSLGYNFKYKGTHYIYDTIVYIYTSNNFDLLDNLENNVYKIIANKNNKSINNIKTNIIKSTKLASTKENVQTPKSVVNDVLIKLMNEFSLN